MLKSRFGEPAQAAIELLQSYDDNLGVLPKGSGPLTDTLKDNLLAYSPLAFCKTLVFILNGVKFGVSSHDLWRQRITGNLLSLPFLFTLFLIRLLTLHGAQLLIFLALLLAYAAAYFARDAPDPIVWLLYLCEGIILAFFIRETGGAASPFQALTSWMFGAGSFAPS